jgi:tetratricopeptide (TPR) repeat protein
MGPAWSRPAGLLAALLCCRCGEGAAPDRNEVTLELSGCRPLLAPLVCVPPPDLTIRILVVAPSDGTISLSWPGGPLVHHELAASEGRLVSVGLPAAARSLRLELRGKSGVASRIVTLAAKNPRLAEAERHRQTEPDRALALADSAEHALTGSDAIRARSLRARLLRDRGRASEAEDLLGETSSAHAALGDGAEAVEDLLMLAYLRIRAGRYADAARALDDAEPAARSVPDNWARLPYFRGVIARRVGDLRGALTFLREADGRARRLGLASDVPQQLSLVLLTLGRWDEATTLLGETLARAGGGDPCAPGFALLNRSWAVLVQRDGGGNPAGFADAVGSLERAARLFSTTCLDPEQAANARTNLALAALLAGDADAAGRQLAEAERTIDHPTAQIAGWWLDLEGRIQARRGRTAPALESYRRLERLGIDTVDPDARWRALVGRGRVLQTAGRVENAIQAFEQAEALLDDQRFWVPLTEGRELFLGRREASVRALVELLHGLGRDARALEAVRRARSRAISALARLDALATLGSESRVRWQRAVEAFQTERSVLASEAAADWQRPMAELARIEQRRKARQLHLEDRLDEALAVLAPAGRSAGPPPLSPAEVLLAYVEGTQGWLGFVARGGSVTTQRLGASMTTARGELLLAPFASSLEGARHVRVLPWGDLGGVDFHALALGAAPLIESMAVSYALDLPAVPSRPRRTDALIVADPRGDLPRARAEGAAVSKALRERGWTVTLLEGTAVTRQALLAGLPANDLLHWAGHGEFDGAGGWHSALPLAAAEQLTAADILLLPAVPRSVVLSGCDTGRAARQTPVEGMGLAHAFLAAGAEEVVAATRPVDDAAARALMDDYYQTFAASPDAAEALRSAQRHQLDRGSDWPAFRVLTR